MIPGSGPPAGVKVLVATKPVDFRRGMDGLAGAVKEELGADPFSGVVYVFRAKRSDRINLLYWDGSGLVLYAADSSDRGRPFHAMVGAYST